MFLFRQISVSPPQFVAADSPLDYYHIIKELCPSWVSRLPPPNSTFERALQCIVPAAVAVANAARIGEVLSITWNQVLPNGQAIVRGEKHSRSRIITLGFPCPFPVKTFKTLNNVKVFRIPYKSIWRYCTRYGLTESIKGHMNKAVTHAGRYRVLARAAECFGEESAGEVIGHRNKTSALAYLGKTDLDLDRERHRQRRRLAKAIKELNEGIKNHER